MSEYHLAVPPPPGPDLIHCPHLLIPARGRTGGSPPSTDQDVHTRHIFIKDFGFGGNLSPSESLTSGVCARKPVWLRHVDPVPKTVYIIA